ncbi:MAG: helicase-related protein [Rubrobacter sp.]
MEAVKIPDFLDNGYPKTYQVLDHYLRGEPRADFASGYFNLGGYGLLREALAEVPVLRLLLSKEPGRISEGGELYPAGFRADLAGTQFSKRNMELTRELIELLREDKVEVRLFTEGFFHAKAYVFGGVGIVGSSNFTAAGLTSNSELNSVHKQGYAADELRRWFEGFWERSEEYKEDLIQLLEESKFDSRQYSPFEVFMKSLYEYYREEIELDEAEKQPPGSSLVPLANFQEFAYKRGLQILDRYDGLLVADSVGLGKTWIGKKLLEHYGYFMRQNCLVVCPAQLRQMWEAELASATIPHRVVTMEKLGQKDFDPLEFRDYPVVLIDESHNFRNANNRYDSLSRLTSAGSPKKVIMLTATPINNGVFDLYNQVSLFTRGDERYFAASGIPYLRKYFVDAVENGDLLNLMEEVAVRRTRHFVAEHYPDAEIDGKRIHFPKRRLVTERYSLEAVYKGLYGKIAAGIEDLNLVSYNREALVREKGRRESEAQQRNEALIAIIKTGFLKRFESSVAAFRKSVGNQLAFQRAFLEVLKEGRILDAATYRRSLAVEEDPEVSEVLTEALPRISADGYDEEAFTGLVEEDIRTLERLYAAVADIGAGEDEKLWQLAYLLDGRPEGSKTLVFTTFKDTAEYLDEAFRENPGLGLGGKRLEVLHGGIAPETRTNVIQRFAPLASGHPEISGRGDEIDVLLTTDVLSEGQNLQDADSVVNYDLHWNPTKMVQRVGRIDRLGSPHSEIAVHNFFPDEGLDELLGLMQRLAVKIEAIDRNVGLESTILGEKVNPKDFNALKRIEDEDQAVTAELEAETEVSGEVLRQILADYLKEFGTGRLERVPYGVHSGFASGKPGFFFHFRVRDKHIWRLYDEESGEILESHLGIYKRIRCERETPRVDSGRDAHVALAEVKESLLVDLNARIGASAAPTQLFKEQRDALAILRSNLTHPTVAREDSVELTKIVRRPLARTLRRELRDMLSAYDGSEDYETLVSELQSFVGRYELDGNATDRPSENGAGVEKEIVEDELELVSYLDLSYRADVFTEPATPGCAVRVQGEESS